MKTCPGEGTQSPKVFRLRLAEREADAANQVADHNYTGK
jgi:hypothetical protein